jgi:hypothetical protein
MYVFSIIIFWDSWPLKMKPIGCSEMFIRNCHYSLCNNPEECSFHLRSYVLCNQYKIPDPKPCVTLQKVSLKLTSIMGTLHDDLHTFKIISRWTLRMRNVSDKNCRENQNARFMFNNFILKNCAVYEIMWGGQGPSRDVEPVMMMMMMMW